MGKGKDLDLLNDVEFLEGWLNLLETDASPEDKFEYCRKYGFVSETHLSLWMAVEDECYDMQYDLDLMKSHHHVSTSLLEKEVNAKKELASAIRKPDFYIKCMISLGKDDISPYGEDLIKKYKEVQ